jgi:hypothetical protein
MPMPPYPIHCYRPECGRPATYKIAARWSDGVTEELKTYALTCDTCLAEFLKHSRERQSTCRLSANETLEPPGVYQLRRGRRDRQLPRMRDLERQSS